MHAKVKSIKMVVLLMAILCAGALPVMAQQANDAPVQIAGGFKFMNGGTTQFVLVGGGSQSVITTYWDGKSTNPKARVSLKEYVYSTPGKDTEFEGGATFTMIQAYPGNFYIGAGVGAVLDIQTGANPVYAAYACEAAYRWSMVSFMAGGQYLFGDTDQQIVFVGIGIRP